MAEHHKVPVVRITDIKKHPNADTLGLIHIDGYQVVVKLSDFVIGDLAVYIHPDSVVPVEPQYSFLWADSVGVDASEVPEKYRRITVRRFRKEWSEGLLLDAEPWMIEGQDVSEQLGITHWAPLEPGEQTYGGGKSKSGYPRSAKGWAFFLLHKFLRIFGIGRYGITGGSSTKGPSNNPPKYDVEAYKNHTHAISEGTVVRITEKIHGSNARFVYSGGKMHAGSRNLWKGEKAKCIWRDALAADSRIETWCRTHPGYTLYGEVTPTQKTRNGKDFHYGSPFTQFFVFDIFSPDNTWLTPAEQDLMLEDSGLKVAPTLVVEPFSLESAKTFVDGKSALTNDHVREGIVIRPYLDNLRETGLGRVQLKLVSNQYLEVA